MLCIMMPKIMTNLTVMKTRTTVATVNILKAE